MKQTAALALILALRAGAAPGAYPELPPDLAAVFEADTTGPSWIYDVPPELMPEGIDSLIVLPLSSFSDRPSLQLVGKTGDSLFDLGPVEFEGIYNSAKTYWAYEAETGTVIGCSQLPFSASEFDMEYSLGDVPPCLTLIDAGQNDPSERELEQAIGLLDSGLLEQADSVLMEMFYPGHYYDTDEMAARFLRRGHELALDAFNAGDTEAACSLMAEAVNIGSDYMSANLFSTKLDAAGYSELRISQWLPGGSMAEIVNDQGYFLAESGRNREALPLLQWVVRLDPGRPVAWLNLADVLWQLGRTEEAAPCYERYLVLLDEEGLLDHAPSHAIERSGR